MISSSLEFKLEFVLSNLQARFQDSFSRDFISENVSEVMETSSMNTTLPWEFDFENFAKFLKMRGWRQYAWVFDSQNYPECSNFYADPFHI